MADVAGKHRAFGFVEFESADDAADAIFNMHNSELNGRVLNVNIAKPMTVSERSQKAIWSAEADSYFEKEGWVDGNDEGNATEIQDDGAADEGLQPSKGAPK